MSLRGTEEEKLMCLLQGQQALMSKMDENNTNHALEVLQMKNDIKDLKLSAKEQKENELVIRELNELVKDIDRRQKILFEERAASREFWIGIRNKLAQTTILGALGLILTALWFYLKNGPPL